MCLTGFSGCVQDVLVCFLFSYLSAGCDRQELHQMCPISLIIAAAPKRNGSLRLTPDGSDPECFRPRPTFVVAVLHTQFSSWFTLVRLYGTLPWKHENILTPKPALSCVSTFQLHSIFYKKTPTQLPRHPPIPSQSQPLFSCLPPPCNSKSSFTVRPSTSSLQNNS